MMMGNRDWVFQQEARKPQAVAETLARFWGYFRQYSLVLVLEIALVIASTYLQVIIPNLIGQAVDCFLAPATQTQLRTITVASTQLLDRDAAGQRHDRRLSAGPRRCWWR